MNPTDVLGAWEIGADGIIVSKHSGRQIDQVPASCDVLLVVEGVGDKLVVMIDGGFRRGAGIVTALCPGVRLVFIRHRCEVTCGSLMILPARPAAGSAGAEIEWPAQRQKQSAAELARSRLGR